MSGECHSLHVKGKFQLHLMTLNNNKSITKIKPYGSWIYNYYRGVQFYWWRKPEYPEKTTTLSQVTDKLSIT
jgi:hypothetical protein